MSVTVGVIGAGQLALMMVDEISKTGVRVAVLAEHETDPACRGAHFSSLGSPFDVTAVTAFAAQCDVVTLDHELVDLALLEQLAAHTPVRPAAAAVRFASDKAWQREQCVAAGIPVPDFVVVAPGGDFPADFVQKHGPVVLKIASGGYDGRGVVVAHDEAAARRQFDEWRTHTLVVEEFVTLISEAAQQVCVAVDGTHVRYPIVTTVQSDGMCVETRYPSELDIATLGVIDALSQRLLALIQPVGMMAIEYFVTPQGVLVNEVALRPHNTGHWTIEGTTAGQFENHLRAVAGLPLAIPVTTAESAVMVNLTGGHDVPRATPVGPQEFLHDYAKAWRPNRKLGHVTVLGERMDDVRHRAWEIAHQWGTGSKEPT